MFYKRFTTTPNPAFQALNVQKIISFLVSGILSLLSAQNASTTFAPKYVRSGDLPEDYHMATVRTEASDHSIKTTTLRDEDSVTTTEANPTDSPTTNTSDVAAARSFTIDASDPELNQPSTEPQQETTSTKPQKVKKKILISRPKSDKLESRFNQTDSDLKKRSEEAFYSFSSTTTEVSNGRQITSSLLIAGIDNNNLVIETSVRPVQDTTPAAHVDNRNTIYGQTDWVPLVSKRTDNTARRRRPSSTSRPIRFPDSTAESMETSTEMDVAVWALATSQLTRRPINASDVELVSFFSPPNNTLYKRVKENAQLRVTEKPDDNVTREHNQVLKNTIPDSVIVETTPSIMKWRPVVTTQPDKNSTQDTSDVERTMAYEIMKITTVLPPQTSPSVEENQVLNSTEPVVENATVPSILNLTTTQQPINATEPAIVRETTEIPKNVTTVPTVMKLLDTPANTTEVVPTVTPMILEFIENSTEKGETVSVVPMVLEILENVGNKTTDEEVGTTVDYEVPTTTEGETTEYPGEEKREKTSDENRTILENNTSVDFPVLEEITEENVPAYLRLTVKTSEIELCHLLPELRTSILKILSEGTNT